MIFLLQKYEKFLFNPLKNNFSSHRKVWMGNDRVRTRYEEYSIALRSAIRRWNENNKMSIGGDASQVWSRYGAGMERVWSRYGASL